MAGVLKIRNSADTAWITLGGSGGVIQQASEPTTPHAGMLWHDTDAVIIGAYKIVDNDGDTHVDVEGTGDEDKVKITCAGTLIGTFSGVTPHFKITASNPVAEIKMNADTEAAEWRISDATGIRSVFGQYGRSNASEVGYIYDYKNALHCINWTEWGEVTMPNQPSVTVVLSTAYTIPSTGSDLKVDFDSEVHDVGNNYLGSTQTFTAPEDGYYLCMVNLSLTDIDTAADYYRPGIRTSNRDFWGPRMNPEVFSIDRDYFPLHHTVIAWMDKDDTLTFSIRQQGGTASQTDVETVGSYASITLIS